MGIPRKQNNDRKILCIVALCDSSNQFLPFSDFLVFSSYIQLKCYRYVYFIVLSMGPYFLTGRQTAIVVSISVVGGLLVISALLGFCYRRGQRKHLPLAIGNKHNYYLLSIFLYDHD